MAGEKYIRRGGQRVHIRRVLCIGDWTYCGLQISKTDEVSDGALAMLMSGAEMCKTCSKLDPERNQDAE